MAFNAKRILLMAALAVIMQEAVAAAWDLAAPSPMKVTNIVTNDDEILQWLKITAVPLVVFLMGACIWSYFKNMALWKRLTGAGVESPNAPLDRTANSNASSNRDAPDLEVGLEMSHRRNMHEELATTPAQDVTVQDPALEAPHDGESAIPKVTSVVTLKVPPWIHVCTSNIIRK